MRSVIGRYGETWYYGKDEYVGRSVHNYGEFSPEECAKIISLASGLCLDIGANIGCISQALRANQMDVVAFEPQPEIFKLLIKNIGIGTQAYNCALGSESGTTLMPRVDYSRRGNFGGMACNTRSELGHIKVPVKPLDSFDFKGVGFIKLDVEGFELSVLKGGEATIKRDRPIMYIEDDRSENSRALRAYIVSLGYTIEEHNPPLYCEDNFFGKKVNIWHPMNYISKNIICRPC